MKKHLLLLLIALPLLFSACTKVVVDQPATIVGSWTLLYAEKQDPYRTTTIYTGYEQGLFHFYGNGQAVYDDGFDILKGNWRLRQVNGYYDAHGHYHSGSYQVFSLYLSNYNGSRIIEWDFDESWFSNSSRFTAMYYGYDYDYKYVFGRY